MFGQVEVNARFNLADGRIAGWRKFAHMTDQFERRFARVRIRDRISAQARQKPARQRFARRKREVSIVTMTHDIIPLAANGMRQKAGGVTGSDIWAPIAASFNSPRSRTEPDERLSATL